MSRATNLEKLLNGEQRVEMQRKALDPNEGIDSIYEWAVGLGLNVSRSGVGRCVKKYRNVLDGVQALEAALPYIVDSQLHAKLKAYIGRFALMAMPFGLDRRSSNSKGE